MEAAKVKASSAVRHLDCVWWDDPGEVSTGSNKFLSAGSENREASDDHTHAGLVCGEVNNGGDWDIWQVSDVWSVKWTDKQDRSERIRKDLQEEMKGVHNGCPRTIRSQSRALGATWNPPIKTSKCRHRRYLAS